MGRLQMLAMVAGCLGTSLLGGALSQRLFAREALAEEREEAPAVLRTRRLEILDAGGKLRGVFATDKQGDPVLAFTDAQGNVRVSVAITKDGSPGIALCNADGVAHFGAALTKDGEVAINLQDAKARVRGSLGLTEDGDAFLRITDANGAGGCLLSDGKGKVTIHDVAGAKSSP